MFVMISEPAGCPNASLEAMHVGLPVIATDFGGATEQVIFTFIPSFKCSRSTHHLITVALPIVSIYRLLQVLQVSSLHVQIYVH
jgi:hypothetical protein